MSCVLSQQRCCTKVQKEAHRPPVTVADTLVLGARHSHVWSFNGQEVFGDERYGDEKVKVGIEGEESKEVEVN